MFLKAAQKFLIFTFFANCIQKSVAQEIRVIDNKGTLKTVINNSVTSSTTAPTTPLEGDIWYDTSTAPTIIKIYNDNVWANLSHTGTKGSVFFAATNGVPTENNSQLFWDNTSNTLKAKNVSIPSKLLDSNGDSGTANQILSSTATGTDWVNNANWLITGNNGTTASNFLGTTDDVKMQIRSNNIPMLEFGRRQTLGLVNTGRLDYTDPDQNLVYLKGNNITAGLQFAASAAEFYKPMFFTTTNGSFRLKGSSGGTDLFEIGSAGSNNDGRLELIVGDDGNEPIVFKSFNHRNGGFNKELFRVQGSEDSEFAKTRFGININSTQVAVATDYNDSQTGLNKANSTFQVNGSISKSILTTTAALTLTEDHYTIILGGNHTITLPPSCNCTGRIYVIKNKNAFATTITSYVNELGTNSTSIKKNTTLWLQNDGTNWQQITSNFTETVTSLTQNDTSTTGEITYTDENGNTTGKAQVVSANASNTISVGTDGGAYLGPTVYTGFFIIPAPGGTATSTTNQSITGLPFKPSQITFVAHANVESLNINEAGSSANNINNSFGTMNGFARIVGTTITQQIIYVGGSGQSINNITRFASSTNCIGIRYGNQNADDIGRITASLTSFNTNGFTIRATHTLVTNADILNESLVVLYTAYK